MCVRFQSASQHKDLQWIARCCPGEISVVVRASVQHPEIRNNRTLLVSVFRRKIDDLQSVKCKRARHDRSYCHETNARIKEIANAGDLNIARPSHNAATILLEQIAFGTL